MPENQNISHKDFHIFSCQASLFTPEEEAPAQNLFKEFFPTWEKRFDGEPIVLPTMDGLPREALRLRLESKDKSWRCDIASERINLFWRRVTPDTAELAMNDFFKEAAKILNDYRLKSKARAGRVAGVIKRYADIEDPAMFLAKHFCSERWLNGPINEPESLELHTHKVYQLRKSLKVNSWVRSRTAAQTYAEKTKPVVMIEQDINTLSEELERKFDGREIKTFFTALPRHFEEILLRYYPED